MNVRSALQGLQGQTKRLLTRALSWSSVPSSSLPMPPLAVGFMSRPYSLAPFSPASRYHGGNGFCSRTRGSLRIVLARAFSSTTQDEAGEAGEEWKSMATREFATAQHRNIQISPRKLQEIIRPIRRLSCDEAMIQMRLSSKKKAVFVENCIRNACVHAVNNYNMDRSRLVIDEINATKGRYLKRINFHARGRTGIRTRYYAHLKVRVREEPPHPDEVKLGAYGRRHTTIKNTLAQMEKFKEFKEKEKEKTKEQYK